jgi:hypothetical protein
MRKPNNEKLKRSFLSFITGSTFVILIATLGCTTNPKPSQERNIIQPFSNVISTLYTSQFIDDIKFIPLETTKDNLMGGPLKLLKTEDKYYILDVGNNKKFFVFDTTGKFLYSFGKYGRGPGEYSNPGSFTIDKERKCIYLIDESLKIIKMGMDGTLILEKKVPKDYRNFTNIVAQDGKIFVSSGQEGGNEKKYQVLEFDENLNPQNWYLPYEYDFPGLLRFGNRLYKYNNSIYFVNIFESSVYQKTGDHFSERFKLDVQGNELNLKDLTDIQFVENKTGVYLFQSILEGDDLIFLPIFSSGRPKVGFLHKPTNKYHQVDKIVEDSYPLLILMLSSFYDGKYISIVGCDHFKKIFPKSNLDPKITDNPIIVEYKLSYKDR